MKPFPISARRWPRHQVDVPVSVIIPNGCSPTSVPGRDTQVSQGGMALHARVDLNPGDLIEVQFLVPYPLRVRSLVHNRSGDSFGLEFVAVLPRDNATMSPPTSAAIPALAKPEAAGRSVAPERLYLVLRRKQIEIQRVKREIEALHRTAFLLRDDADRV